MVVSGMYPFTLSLGDFVGDIDIANETDMLTCLYTPGSARRMTRMRTVVPDDGEPPDSKRGPREGGWEYRSR